MAAKKRLSRSDFVLEHLMAELCLLDVEEARLASLEQNYAAMTQVLSSHKRTIDIIVVYIRSFFFLNFY